MAIVGAIPAEEVSILCERLRATLAGALVEVVVCDVGAAAADLTAVHALARLALTARGMGCRFQLRAPSRELAELLELCGLTELLPVAPTRRGRAGE